MTKDEKQIIVDLFEKFQYVYWKCTVLEDMTNKILIKKPKFISEKERREINKMNAGVTAKHLKHLEKRINAIKVT